ncbi:MAG: DNA polymerase IV [Desulfobacteraceae bacterium]
MQRVILHVDMDAFYAAVEQLDRPELRGKPVVVGGTGRRGVVSTASYEARVFGVRSAMPIFQAKRLCPHGIFLPVRMARYKEVSCKVMEVLKDFSPSVEQVSIDEAYIDLTGSRRLNGPPVETGREIKRRIMERTSLTGSVGVAPNRFLAKVASDMEKPDGLTVIRPEDVDSVVHGLELRKVPGVGAKTAAALESEGLRTLGDVLRLQGRPGGPGSRLLELARGMDETPVEKRSEVKSISSEETLCEDTADAERLKAELLAQSEIVGARARMKGLQGVTVTLKLKKADFGSLTRSATLARPTASTYVIYREGVRLLQRTASGRDKYRLIGIGLSNLSPVRDGHLQLSLFESHDPLKAWESLEQAVDEIRTRFGRDAITRARFL